MRICLLATNGFTHDPRARATAHQLAAAGHHVVVVASGRPPDEPCPFEISWIPTDAGRFRRRRSWLDRLAEAGASTDAQLFHACSAQAVAPATAAARLTGGTVTRRPDWPDAGDVDLVTIAPSRPMANPPVRPTRLLFHTPGDDRDGYQPQPDRHRGRSLTLIHRRTTTNPGRYLGEALDRAGVDITLLTQDSDWAEAAGTEAILFVESPPPALKMTGARPSVPIGFWVHHGEHHLAANLRLTRRYAPDFVLLAHSWHLAHYFPVPVIRFPFAVPPELYTDRKAWPDRHYDVAMVGAHLRQGGPYPLRHALVHEIESRLGSDLVAFEEGVSVSRMAELYSDARIVPNEGGTRHFPITMRIFEAIGAGALLWSRPTPGLDELFTPGDHYLPMDDDFLAQLEVMLANSSHLEHIAEAGHDQAYARHTYDHRVDELFAAIDTGERAHPAPEGPLSTNDPISAWIDADVEIQRILDATQRRLADSFPDREVWTLDQVPQPAESSFSAVAIDDSTPNPEWAAGAARKFIYAEGSQAATAATMRFPSAHTLESGGVTRVDLLPGTPRGTIQQ